MSDSAKNSPQTRLAGGERVLPEPLCVNPELLHGGRFEPTRLHQHHAIVGGDRAVYRDPSSLGIDDPVLGDPAVPVRHGLLTEVVASAPW